MRYWIWWNDLIQGPFELDELTSLKAFSEDLLVCMEDRQEWIPASRIADLSSAVDQLRERHAAPSVPPPPPPKRSPSVTPLQGEFFGDPPGQDKLLDTDDGPKGPFAFIPVTGDAVAPAWTFLEGRATMPFHFSHQPAVMQTAVLELPRPTREATATLAPPPPVTRPPVSRESPVRKFKEEPKPIPLNIVETAPPAPPPVEREMRPSMAPSFDEEFVAERKPHFLLWVLGVLAIFVALGSVSYWLLDRASTHSAITEASRMSASTPRTIVTKSVSPAQAMRNPGNDLSVEAAINKKTEEPGMFKRLLAFFGLGKSIPAAGAALPAGSAASDSAVNSAPSSEQATASIGARSASGRRAAGRNTATPLEQVLDGSAPSVLVPLTNIQHSEGVTVEQVPANQEKSKVGQAVGSAAKQVKEVMNAIKNSLLAFFGLTKAMPVPAGVVVPAASPAEGAAGAAAAGARQAVLRATGSTSPVAAEVSQYAAAKSRQAAAARQKKAMQLAQRKAATSHQRAAHRTTASGGSEAEAEVSGASNAQASDQTTIVPGTVPGSTTEGSAASVSAQNSSGNKMNPAAGKAHAAGSPGGSVASVVPGMNDASRASGAAARSAGAVANAAKGATASSLGETVASPALPVVDSSIVSPTSEINVSPSPSAPNPWKGKQSQAIALVLNKHLPKSKTTVGDQARTMLQEMHEKELIHAAETGERLYLPDKIGWAALEEEGPVYRVYLNFMAMQANGERVQSRSYQFIVDLKTKVVRTEDPAAQQDLLTQSRELTFKHNPMATDIESILGGVDIYNKHKVQMIIIKKNNRNREDRKKIEAAMTVSLAKIHRAVLYFRKTYTEQALQNIAKAYEFSDLLKG